MPKKQISRDHGTVRVTFELPAAVGGEVVHLVGDFTGWEGIPMKRREDGGWRATLDLAPGSTYEYRYLIDGERWENDWAADRYVRNAFGHENSVIETPALHAAADTRSPEGDRTAAEIGVAKKATAKKATSAKRSGAGKAAAKKTTAKKAPAKKAPAAKKSAKKTTAKRAAKGAAARKPTREAGSRESGSEAAPPRNDKAKP